MNITATAHPIIVKRDDTGFWRHPDMPEFFPGDPHGFDAWSQRQGFEIHTINERLLGDEFLDWNPDRPDGEGWFDLEVAKKGSMASWTWARRTAP